MLTTHTVEKALELLDEGFTYPSITQETGITAEDASAVGMAYFKGEAKQLFRDVQLAGVLEPAASKLRSGEGWDEGTTGEVLREILHAYRDHVKKALALALLSGKL